MVLSKKYTTWLAVLSLAVLVGLAGCDSELSPSDSSPNRDLQADNGQSLTTNLESISKSEMEDRLRQFAKTQEREGGVAEAKLKEILSRTSDQSDFRKLIMDKVVDGDQYECGPVPLDDWISENVFYSSIDEQLYVLFYGIDQFPYLYNLIFVDADEERQYYGANGEYTRQIRRVDRNIKRFWDEDVDLSDVDVEAFHGSMLNDFDKVFRLVEVLYPSYTEESNAEFAQTIVDVVADGDNPVWSFNAFAFQEGPILVGGEDKAPQVQMGDGILAGMDGIGLGDAAPAGILAHEMGHHIQYKLNVFADDTTSDPVKATRRTELMADAFAAYYLGHKRGGAMNWDRVEEFMLGFYNVGDCSFSSSNHHGTPNQRLKAAEFGFQLAENARRRTSIMASSDFVEAFDAELPNLVAPDAEEN